MVLPSSIRATVASNGTIERFTMIRMNLSCLTDGGEGVIRIEPLTARSALRPFDFDRDF